MQTEKIVPSTTEVQSSTVVTLKEEITQTHEPVEIVPPLPTPVENPVAIQKPTVEALDPSSFPHSTQLKNGEYSVRTTLQNVEHLLHSYGIIASYCVIKKKVSIHSPGLVSTPENYSSNAMTNIISLAQLNCLSVGSIPTFVAAIADKNQLNPVADWIMRSPWDKTDRLPEFYATLTTAPEFPSDLKERLLCYWLMSAVAAALKPRGFNARGVLTLQGPQGIGKTSWVKSLINDESLRESVLKTSLHIDAGNKDSIITAVSHWIGEFGELDSSFKRDIARLKGFVTSDSDKLRKPYAHGDIDYPRRTVFCASVNEVTFLVDDTGNSRFWTIPVVEINYNHGIDMQQLFAQLAVDFQKGDARWWLNQDEELLLAQQNKKHQSVSATRELIISEMDNEMPEVDRKFLSATDVLRALGIKNPTNKQAKEAATVLRELLGDSRRRKGKDGWCVPMAIGFIG